MADMNDIVRVAVDAYKGQVTKYSVGESMDVLHKALVAANNNSTTLDYKAIRDGKCSGLFTIIEEIIPRTVVEGLQGDEFFNNLVEYRNLPLGDKNRFLVEDNDLFVVAEAADGTQGIRRQRLGGVAETSIPTTFHVVKIYEELNRVLAGQVDFNHFIAKVAESYKKQILDDIYTLWIGATANDLGGAAFFPAAGAYDEDTLLGLIEHVEAASNGKPVTLIGTKSALRNLMPSVVGCEVKSDVYNMGYVGKFFGSNVMAVPQRHKVNSTEMVFDNKMITIVAGDMKPIKFVYEGGDTVILGNPMNNADLTQEYLYGNRYGLGLVMAGGNAGIGRYQMA